MLQPAPGDAVRPDCGLYDRELAALGLERARRLLASLGMGRRAVNRVILARQRLMRG